MSERSQVSEVTCCVQILKWRSLSDDQAAKNKCNPRPLDIWMVDPLGVVLNMVLMMMLVLVQVELMLSQVTGKMVLAVAKVCEAAARSSNTGEKVGCNFHHGGHVLGS